jgi:hypothetical protein
MVTATKSHKSVKPARRTHGTCYLIATGNRTLEQALDSGDALLTVHTDRCTNYLVQRLIDSDGETVDYRLMKLTDYIVDRNVYDIDVTLGKDWLCDCPDAQFRNHECKHVRALREALASNAIVISAPQRQEPVQQQQTAKREPWCSHCNDQPGVYCSHCSLALHHREGRCLGPPFPRDSEL